MKLKFKQQAYQTQAVEAVADCFVGQPKSTGVSYRIDPGRGGAQVLRGITVRGLGGTNAYLYLESINISTSKPPEARAEQVLQLIDTVFNASQLPATDDERKAKVNPLNGNFEKKEFQELWSRINRKAAYTVHFEAPELVKKCVTALDKELKSKLQNCVRTADTIG